MSHRTASITAYDMFGLIFVTVVIRDHDGMAEFSVEPEYHCSASIRSTGEDEPAEWLQQALMGLLESL